jgi:hypothetical protein
MTLVAVELLDETSNSLCPMAASLSIFALVETGVPTTSIVYALAKDLLFRADQHAHPSVVAPFLGAMPIKSSERCCYLAKIPLSNGRSIGRPSPLRPLDGMEYRGGPQVKLATGGGVSRWMATSPEVLPRGR